MPRKGHVFKREILPDPIYDNLVVTKLINNIIYIVMIHGIIVLYLFNISYIPKII